MRLVSKNPVLVAGLAGALILGMAGCSVSSESTTTTSAETSTTDEEGNTTTTTETTTTTSGSGEEEQTTEETTTEEASGDYYENQYYAIRFNLPEGFTSSERESDIEGETIDYFASDDDGCFAKFVLVKGVTQIEGVTDAISWAQVWGNAADEALAQKGETDVNLQAGAGTIGSLETGAVHVESKLEDGTPVLRDVYFIVDDEGDGMRIELTAVDEARLATLRDSMAHLVSE